MVLVELCEYVNYIFAVYIYTFCNLIGVSLVGQPLHKRGRVWYHAYTRVVLLKPGVQPSQNCATSLQIWCGYPNVQADQSGARSSNLLGNSLTETSRMCTIPQTLSLFLSRRGWRMRLSAILCMYSMLFTSYYVFHMLARCVISQSCLCTYQLCAPPPPVRG